jgi:predicted RNA polymerase sigma factor
VKHDSRPAEHAVIEALVRRARSPEDQSEGAANSLEILRSWRKGIPENPTAKILAKVCATREIDVLR